MHLDEKFLQEMGLSAMPEDKKQEFLNYIQEELEVRIGRRIAEGVPEDKLQEFDTLTDMNAIGAWLEKNRPDYHQIVTSCVEEMKQAIRANQSRLVQN
ncbi:hypothetical protein IJ076_01965 [Candidatus Saccharibacteria bacterium]|nr:hypothetical protein [Candidatus Saccharibacteria bacterium]